MGTNWWLKVLFVLFLILMAIRALVPTFAFQKPEYMPAFRVEYELGPDGKPKLDKNGKPKIKYERYTSGKNKGKIKKDENGDPIPVFARDENGNCIPEWTYSKAYVLDPKTGQKKIDPKTKKPIIRTYPERRSIYDKKPDEEPIDLRKEYVMEVVRDKDGHPVYETKVEVVEIEVKGKDGKVKKIKKKVEKKVVKKVPKRLTDAVWERCFLPWWYKKFFPYKSKLRLGLDLQGGTHLVLGVDVDKALSTKAASLAKELTVLLRRKNLIPPPDGEDENLSRYVFHPINEIYVEVTIPTFEEILKANKPKEKEWAYSRVAYYLSHLKKDKRELLLSPLSGVSELKDLLKKAKDNDEKALTDLVKKLVELRQNGNSTAAQVLKSITSEWEALQLNRFRKFISEFREGIIRLERTTADNKFRLRYDDETIKRAKDAAINQALETIRNRVDSLGVSEPSISRYGETQIVIQLPGLKNPKRAKELIGKTAILTFHVVEDDHPDSANIFEEMRKDAPEGIKSAVTTYRRPPEAKTSMGYDRFFYSDNKKLLRQWVAKWNKKLAEGFAKNKYSRLYMILLGKYETLKKGETLWRTYLLWREASITGDMLEEARPQIDPQTNQPEVGLTFNLEGADKFEEMTGKHIGHRFAIVLEGEVDSAPVIQTKIAGGRARITLGGVRKTYDELLQDAKDLAFILKSGSLPAPVDILYEKVIGPTLGRDSIQRGLLSLAIGFVLVMIFMVIYYRLSGINAVIALLLNMLFIFSIMASFGATLTLPGLAGILLTIGMAVDANILIFERIREELLANKAPRVAVNNGYDKAFVTILDANITTAIAGIVLYQYGSGPIRGFAVTLLIGIVCSVFTALFVTKLIYDAILSRRNVTSISI